MTGDPLVTHVVAVDPRTDPRWRQLAAGPQGSLFTSPGWISAVCDSYGFTPQARLALNSDQAVGGLAWVSVQDLRGDRLVSLPFSDRADPLLVEAGAWTALVDEATATGIPFTMRCLDGTTPTEDPRFTTVGEAAWHNTPLDAPIDDLHRRLSSAVRRNIATARRAEVDVVASSGLAAIHVYHRLHVALRKRKYGLLAQPIAFFERVWKQFAEDDSIVTLIAHVDGQPVAGAVYLVWRDGLYYKFGASLPEHLSVRPNDAIHWAAIRWATKRGLRHLDWGLSDLDQPGLVQYKRKWATVERRIVTLRTGEVRRAPETDRLLTELTALFIDEAVPDDVTKRAGALLYRYFC